MTAVTVTKPPGWWSPAAGFENEEDKMVDSLSEKTEIHVSLEKILYWTGFNSFSLYFVQSTSFADQNARSKIKAIQAGSFSQLFRSL